MSAMDKQFHNTSRPTNTSGPVIQNMVQEEPIAMVSSQSVGPFLSNNLVSLPSSSGSVPSNCENLQDKRKSKKDPSNVKSHTVFIHKLYNMLEDSSINHLIWWSETDESFFLIPSEEFCKVLLSYFKHANVASFVRQLNMYGFHKVNDNSNEKRKHSNSDLGMPSSKWEFAHSSNNFRKGDFESLKNIRRRSSRPPTAKEKAALTQHNSEESLKSLNYDPNPINEVDEFLDNNSINDKRSIHGSFSTSNTLGKDHASINRSDSLTSSNINIENGNNSFDERTFVDMTSKLREVSYSLASLQMEHGKLQTQYDSAMTELRSSSLDMVRLLDLFLKVIDGNLQDNFSKINVSLRKELDVFRNSIIQRSKDHENSRCSLYNGGTQNPEPSHALPSLSSNHPSRPRFNSHDLQTNRGKPESEVRQFSYNPHTKENSNKQNKADSPLTMSSDPHSGALSNNDSNYPFKYLINNHSGGSPIYVSTANTFKSNTNIVPASTVSPSANQVAPPPSKFPGQNNVFLHDGMFSSSHSKQRTMSILCDPLAPEPKLPAASNNSDASSPSLESSKNTSMTFSPDSHHQRQNGYFSSISSTRTSDGAIPTFPYTSGSYFNNSSHSDFDQHSSSSNSSTNQCSNVGSHGTPLAHPKQNLKRHSSDDVLFDRSRLSHDSNNTSTSQSTLTFGNPPRSVPDVFNPAGQAKSRVNSISNHSDRSNSVGVPYPTLPPASLLPGLQNIPDSPSRGSSISSINYKSCQNVTHYTPRASLSLVNPVTTPTLRPIGPSSSGVYLLLNKEIVTSPTNTSKPNFGSMKMKTDQNNEVDREHKRMKLDASKNTTHNNNNSKPSET